MTKDETLQMCLEYIETDAHERKYVRHAIKQALAAQPAPVQQPVAWMDKYGEIYKDVPEVLLTDTPLYTTPPAQPADTLTDGVLKITMQIGEIEVSRLLSLDVIRTSNAPEVERHSRQAWLDLQKASHGIAEKGQP
jgi:hypothetical protein